MQLRKNAKKTGSKEKQSVIQGYTVSYLDKKSTRYHRVTLTAFVGLFGLMGAVLLFSSGAAVRKFAAIETSAASRTGNVSVVNDTTATSGSTVLFGAPAGTTTGTSLYAAGCNGVFVAPGADIVSAVAAAPVNATICIATGTFKITAQISPKAGQVLWGNTGTIIDGSRTVGSWSQQGSAWVASGVAGNSNGGGQCDDNVANPCLPTDQVFRNDVHLTRVMSLSAVGPGKFYIDYGANKLYVGDNPAGQNIEIARTTYAIRSANNNVTVKNVVIQKFATNAQQGALFAEGDNWQILNNLIRWNHAAGLFLSGSDKTVVSGNTMTQNGQIGIAHYNSQNVTISNNDITSNNTDGFWIADWESGGYKTTNSSSTFVNNRVRNNLGVGAWVDVDGNGVTIDGNTITGNAADGVRYEISYNGVIKNNTVTGNGYGMKRGNDYSLYAVAGINVNSSTNVDIYGNTVADNANGIGLQMRNRGSGKYGVWALTNATVHNNTVTMKTGTRWGEGATGLVQNVSDNSYFTSKGNRFYDNTYYLDSQTAKRFAWNNTYNTVAAWKAAGQDVNGVFK